MNPIFRILSLCTLFAVSFAAPAFSQNLVVNPNFNTDISGWENSGLGSFDSTMDANGSPSSGSVKGTFTFPIPSYGAPAFIQQCISGITPGKSYDFGGKMRIQSAPGAGSQAFVFLIFRSGSTCSSAPIDVSISTPVTTTGSWVAGSATVTAPAGAGSVDIQADFANGPTPGTMVVNFDDMFFQLSPGPAVPAAVPALSETMLIALALILGGFGALVLGRTS
jgi:hypothetical protein